jgi:hypothetical protein
MSVLTTQEKITKLKHVESLEKSVVMLENKQFTSMGALFYCISGELSQKAKDEILEIALKYYQDALKKLKSELELT